MRSHAVGSARREACNMSVHSLAKNNCSSRRNQRTSCCREHNTEGDHFPPPPSSSSCSPCVLNTLHSFTSSPHPPWRCMTPGSWLSQLPQSVAFSLFVFCFAFRFVFRCVALATNNNSAAAATTKASTTSVKMCSKHAIKVYKVAARECQRVPESAKEMERLRER